MGTRFIVAVSTLILSAAAQAQTPFRCAASPLSTEDRIYSGNWNYDRERVANSYAIYAAASYDAYEPAALPRKPRPFSIADNDPSLTGMTGRVGSTGWRRFGPRVSHGNGLSFDVYHKSDAGRLVVLVAYRGTDGWLDADVLANLSWFSQWINPYDQYRDARKSFAKVVGDAIKVANGRPIAFVTTGHSLGGGLAQHVAAIYPCVSTISFNPSFVTNEWAYGEFRPMVRVRVYEDKDVFSRFAGRKGNVADDALYRMNGAAGKEVLAQHSMEQLSAAMMRTALDCTKRGKHCDILKDGNVAESFTLFCLRYRARRKLPADPVCVRNQHAVLASHIKNQVEDHE